MRAAAVLAVLLGAALCAGLQLRDLDTVLSPLEALDGAEARGAAASSTLEERIAVLQDQLNELDAQDTDYAQSDEAAVAPAEHGLEVESQDAAAASESEGDHDAEAAAGAEEEQEVEPEVVETTTDVKAHHVSSLDTSSHRFEAVALTDDAAPSSNGDGAAASLRFRAVASPIPGTPEHARPQLTAQPPLVIVPPVNAAPLPATYRPGASATPDSKPLQGLPQFATSKTDDPTTDGMRAQREQTIAALSKASARIQELSNTVLALRAARSTESEKRLENVAKVAADAIKANKDEALAVAKLNQEQGRRQAVAEAMLTEAMKERDAALELAQKVVSLVDKSRETIYNSEDKLAKLMPNLSRGERTKAEVKQNAGMVKDLVAQLQKVQQREAELAKKIDKATAAHKAAVSAVAGHRAAVSAALKATKPPTGSPKRNAASATRVLEQNGKEEVPSGANATAVTGGGKNETASIRQKLGASQRRPGQAILKQNGKEEAPSATNATAAAGSAKNETASIRQKLSGNQRQKLSASQRQKLSASQRQKLSASQRRAGQRTLGNEDTSKSSSSGTNATTTDKSDSSSSTTSSGAKNSTETTQVAQPSGASTGTTSAPDSSSSTTSTGTKNSTETHTKDAPKDAGKNLTTSLNRRLSANQRARAHVLRKEEAPADASGSDSKKGEAAPKNSSSAAAPAAEAPAAGSNATAALKNRVVVRRRVTPVQMRFLELYARPVLNPSAAPKIPTRSVRATVANETAAAAANSTGADDEGKDRKLYRGQASMTALQGTNGFKPTGVAAKSKPSKPLASLKAASSNAKRVARSKLKGQAAAETGENSETSAAAAPVAENSEPVAAPSEPANAEAAAPATTTPESETTAAAAPAPVSENSAPPPAPTEDSAAPPPPPASVPAENTAPSTGTTAPPASTPTESTAPTSAPTDQAKPDPAPPTPTQTTAPPVPPASPPVTATPTPSLVVAAQPQITSNQLPPDATPSAATTTAGAPLFIKRAPTLDATARLVAPAPVVKPLLDYDRLPEDVRHAAGEMHTEAPLDPKSSEEVNNYVQSRPIGIGVVTEFQR